MVNEHELSSILKEFGFEVYDPNRRIDQLKVFSESQIIIGDHSSSLANLAFCQPGTKVLEIIPSDHMFPTFYTFAQAGGLQHFFLPVKSMQEREFYDEGPSIFDFEVPPNEFRKALDIICS